MYERASAVPFNRELISQFSLLSTTNALTSWLMDTSTFTSNLRVWTENHEARARSRSAVTSRWFRLANKPVSRHSANQRYTVVRGRELTGEKPPCNATPKSRVDDLAKGPRPGSPAPVRDRHERLDQSPFGITQIGFGAQVIAAMLPPSGRVPRGASREGFDHPLESPPLPLNSVAVQAPRRGAVISDDIG
jgi:hypothetical protein